MVAKFLDDHKPKILLKTEFVLFQTQSLLQFHLICQMVANFSGAEFHRTVFKFRKKKKKRKENFCVVFTYCIKQARETRKFHVAVLQRRLGNVQKSVMRVQSCCFANIN